MTEDEAQFCLQSLANESVKLFKYICKGKNNALDITIMRCKDEPEMAYINIQSKFDLVPQCYCAKVNLKEE